MRVILLLIAFIGAKAVYAEKLDLAFFVDGSGTICGGPDSCDNWKSILQFIHDLVASWVIGPDDTKVALATFGDYARVIWNLNGYTNEEDLDFAILGVPYPGGELQKQGLVKAAYIEIFYDVAAERPDARNISVMITDGAPIIDDDAAAQTSVRHQQEGITVFVVCIAPGCVESFAKNLAAPPKEINKTYFLVDGYDALGGIKDALFEQISNPENGM